MKGLDLKVKKINVKGAIGSETKKFGKVLKSAKKIKF